MGVGGNNTPCWKPWMPQMRIEWPTHSLSSCSRNVNYCSVSWNWQNWGLFQWLFEVGGWYILSNFSGEGWWLLWQIVIWDTILRADMCIHCNLAVKQGTVLPASGVLSSINTQLCRKLWSPWECFKDITQEKAAFLVSLFGTLHVSPPCQVLDGYKSWSRSSVWFLICSQSHYSFSHQNCLSWMCFFLVLENEALIKKPMVLRCAQRRLFQDCTSCLSQALDSSLQLSLSTVG